eukprot:7379381-Prymnesium_polylepis.1
MTALIRDHRTLQSTIVVWLRSLRSVENHFLSVSMSPPSPRTRTTSLTSAATSRLTSSLSTYASSRNDLTTQGYPIEGDAVD